MKVRRVVPFCDICQAPDAIEVNVEIGGAWRRLDLCEEHSKPLKDLMKHGAAIPPRRTGREQPTTLEDVQRKVMKVKELGG